MTRTSLRPIAVLGLVAGLLAYVGCSAGSRSKDGPGASAKPHAPQAKPAENSKLIANWNPPPAGALLISGEWNGYLEPCGCAEGQLGGALRLADLVDRLHQQKWSLVPIHLGSLIKDPSAARGGFEQSKIKFGVALKAIELLKYEALALSAEDLKLGVFEALGQYTSNLGGPTKVVSANVAAPNFETLVVPSVRASAGPVRLGITAVLPPESLEAVSGSEKDELLKIKPIADRLPSVLAELEKDTRFQILMVQGPPDLARDLAAANPGFDIVVAASPLDPAEEPESLNDGKTLLITVGEKGKYVGIVGFYPDAKQPLRYQRVTLNNRYNGPAEAMKQVVQVGFRQQLKDQKIVESFPRHDFVGGAPGATFIGAEACRDCHPNTFAKWASTKHAHAFQSLLDDPKPNTQFDAECVTCHTTGFGYNSGWVSAEATPNLKGNQCENCHGPASKHVEEPDNREFRQAIARSAEAVQKNYFCTRCHDEDNSPKFDFVSFYGKIAHKGLDEYKDPKVHQGRPARAGK